MDFALDDQTELLQRTVREFAQAEVAPAAEELDRTHSFPYEIVAKMASLGWMGIPFPEEVGGAGGTSLQYAIAVEELTRVDSSVAITLCAHTSLGTQPIYLFGSDAQKQEWLPRLCAGEILGAFGLTEPEAGSDAGNTRTRARLQDGEWVINGAKQFITNAGTDISGVVCITARTDDEEISNLIVPNGTDGYEQAEPYRKMGWNASDTRPLTFTDCRVPEENLLGMRGKGFHQFLQVLDIGRIGVAAMGVGLAQGALDQALAYAKERRAFGKPISKFQTIQAKLADLATEIAAARLLVYHSAWLKDQGKPFSLVAAQAKLKTGRLAVKAADEAVQIHGGYGYIEEYPVCRFYRDAKILTIGEGTDEVQQMVIARALGRMSTEPRARRASFRSRRGSARSAPATAFRTSPRSSPPQTKVKLIDALARTGLRRLEITSFVRPDVIPQLADAAEVLQAVDIPDDGEPLGAHPQRARAGPGAGAARPLRRDQRLHVGVGDPQPSQRQPRRCRTRSTGLERVLAAAREAGLRCEGVISRRLRLPYEGDVPPERVFEIAERLAAAGAQEIGFGDTTGMANPRQVTEFFTAARERLPELELTAHFHNTRGQGLANVYAALEAGIDSFESSFGELGGCPVPAGATGNVATEDVVSMLHEMGVADRHRPARAAQACRAPFSTTSAAPWAATRSSPARSTGTAGRTRI